MSTIVTDSGNATDQILTEGAYAHGNAEGKYRRCDASVTHVSKGHNISTCPLGHRCWHNIHIERLERCERRLAECMDKDCPEVDTIDCLTELVERYLAAYTQSYEVHKVRWDHIEKELAHAKNIEKLHKGSWAFTLTYSPLKHGWTKDEAQAVMKEAIRRLRHYYRNELVEFEAIGEWTQAGLPHVHGHYLLQQGKRITTKNFKRAYPIWNPNHRMGKGHEGGYHEPARSDADYTGYIGKDLDDAWLVETQPNGVSTETSGGEEACGAEEPGSPAPPSDAESDDR